MRQRYVGDCWQNEAHARTKTVLDHDDDDDDDEVCILARCLDDLPCNHHTWALNLRGYKRGTLGTAGKLSSHLGVAGT